MIGFEIKSQKESLIAALKDGAVSVIFSRISTDKKNEIHLSVGGLDIEKEEDHNWVSRNLELGEEFIVRIVEISDSSKPLKVGHYPIEKLLLEDKFKRYQNLKKELEEAGLV